MGIYKQRTAFISKALKEVKTEEEKRLLSNGFIPESFMEDYHSFMKFEDEGTDSDLDKISNANWFAINPERVAGTITAGTGFLNPVIVKGNLSDVLAAINIIVSETTKTETKTTPKMNKGKAKKYDLLFTWAGGNVVVSNREDWDNKAKDYRTVAHISLGGKIEYFEKDLPEDVVKKIFEFKYEQPEQAYEELAAKVPVMGDTLVFSAGRFKSQSGKVVAMGTHGNNYTVEMAGGTKTIVFQGDIEDVIKLGSSSDPNMGPEVEITRQDLQVIIKNNLLEDPPDLPKTQTVSETLKKYNPGLTEAEIKAWVYHKRRFGNPMRGWEKYFLGGGAGFSILLQTIRDTTVKDNKFNDLRTIAANTIIGIKTKFKHEYSGNNYVICKTPQGELIWVNVLDFKEQKHQTSESKAELDSMVADRVLIFDGNDYYPYPVYLFGDIYSKIRQLNDNRAAIVEAYGEELFTDQLAKVQEYLPKKKSFRDPIKTSRPNMLCLSEFANDPDQFGIKELHEETGIKLGKISRGRFYEAEEKVSLFEAFNFWLEQAVKDTDLKNTTRADIRKYYFAKSVAWPKDSLGNDELTNTQKQELIGNARLAAEELFAEFLSSGLTFDDSVVLDAIWNERYNAFTSVSQFVDKIPIAFHGSTMFKDGMLDVKPAQRQGLAYLQLVGSGTLAYDVGFGKTLTGILNLAQLMSQGAIKRPLIVVPKPTYKNWLKELFGYWVSADGQRTDFNEFEGAKYHYGAFSGIPGIKLNDWYNLSGKHYERLTKAGDINKLIPENTITVVSYKGFEQMGFSRTVSTEMFDSIARVIMQKDVMEGQERNEKKAAKEKVSFYQKVQGWLGLGNKNAIVQVDVCGFDHVTVDEAHNFKNVFPSCGKDPSTGRKLFDISASQSTRAVKMFFITQYIQAKHGKAVVNLTATPFTNSPLEIYSMLSFVGLDTLNQYNLYNIKKFFEQFVLQTIEYAIDAKGEIVTKPVIKSFQNLKLLQTILFNHFHYKANPKEAGVVRPCLVKLPSKDITTYLEMNERQRANQVEVKLMAKSVSREDPGAGLRAMAMSLDNAFSPFLFDKSMPESAEDFVEQSPKIKYSIECIRTIKQWHESRGEECSGIIIYSNRGLAYFDYIKDYLINNLGFKNHIAYDDEMISEVEIISGGGGEADEDRKELIKDAFNAGVVKIIIGTGAIREGINLQRRSTGTFDLYPEWNPTDIAQLIGRNLRQGNMFGYVRFVMPLVINSMDNFINQKLDEKGKRIASIWAPIGDLNTLDNTSDLDPSEIKYQLVDDVNERFKMKYETLRTDMERQHKILSENKKVITGVEESVESLKTAEEEIFVSLTEKKTEWMAVQKYLKSLPLDKYKKIPEQQKTVKDIERVLVNVSELLEKFTRYETNRMDINLLLDVLRVIKNRSYEIFTDYSNTGQTIRTTLSGMVNYYTFRIYQRDYDNLIENWAEVRKAEKSVLNAYSKSFSDDLSPIAKEIDKKIMDLERQKEAFDSDEYKNRLLHTIQQEMDAQKSVRGDLNEQVARFASLNYLLSYLNDNTDKENCPLPTEECCPTTGIHVLHQAKEISEPVEYQVAAEVDANAEMREAIELMTDSLAVLKGKAKKEVQEAIELIKSALEIEEAA